MFSPHQRTCVVICTPLAKIRGPLGDAIYDPITPLWHRARTGLSFGSNINTVELYVDGMEVGVARSIVAARCLEMKPVPEFVLFIDSDVIVPGDAFVKLLFRARCFPDHDIFAGVYCLKNASAPDPLIYRELGEGPFWDWTVGDLLTTEQHGIKYVHMGLTLIRVSLFQKMLELGCVHGDGKTMDDEPFFCTVNTGRQDKGGSLLLQQGTEDIYFCDKATRMGAKILVDTGVLAGHHDKATGVSYGLPWEAGPAERAKWMGHKGKTQDREEADGANLLLALDIGAGSTRRAWPGHKTYTTDLRADTKPDYVQDTRKLSLPDSHFDLIASSHHLEHLGRWDQESVWREMFRITKPGGKCEHVVPSVEWAAHKIKDDVVYGHVLNVLYGAQEQHGYAREMNTHYFGYTKALGKALAEQAGYVDVVCEDWRDNPELGYNLIIRGTKPTESPEAKSP